MIVIPIEVHVRCNDGICGKSVHLIVNPVSQEVTHFVVDIKEMKLHTQRLVSVQYIDKVAHDSIHLDCAREDIKRMDSFVAARFISPAIDLLPTDKYWRDMDPYMHPWVVPNLEEPMIISEEHIPAGEWNIYRGMDVEASDGRIGQVDELMVEIGSWRITHVILRHGHLLGKRELTISLIDIDRVEADVVYLNIDKDTVKSRSSIPVKRLFS